MLIRWPMCAVLFLRCAIVASVNFGCGPAHPIQAPDIASAPGIPTGIKTSQPEKPNEVSERSPAIDLGLKILKGYLGPLGKVFLENPSSAETYDPKYSKNQISYRKGFLLPDSTMHSSGKKEGLYFVWPDKFHESLILNVSVRHQFINGKNEWVGTSDSSIAVRDFDEQRWRVSLSEIFSEKNYPVGTVITQSETHVLTIGLTLADFSQHSFEVKFRISGAVVP